MNGEFKWPLTGIFLIGLSLDHILVHRSRFVTQKWSNNIRRYRMWVVEQPHLICQVSVNRNACRILINLLNGRGVES